MNTSLFNTELVDILALAINILIVYFVIDFTSVLFVKVKSSKDLNKINDSKIYFGVSKGGINNENSFYGNS